MAKYVITGAQASYTTKGKNKGETARVNETLLEGLEKYCAKNEAELIVLGLPGADISETVYHQSVPQLDNPPITLNSNVQVSDMKVPPQNVDPASGRTRFAQNDQTLIYAHPKQRFKAVPSSNSKLPKLLLTTGVITSPNYHTGNHRGDVAKRDHNFGAAVCEVIDDTFYNVRHIRAFKNGKFADMGTVYNGNSAPRRIHTEALVIGDLHIGETDSDCYVANYEMMGFFKPSRIILHDSFNGATISFHERDQLLTKAKNSGMTLEDELRMYHEEITKMSKQNPRSQIYIVKSNHDVRLERYLQDGQFMREPRNTELGLKLATSMLDGNDPLEYAFNMMGRHPSNVKFLDRRSDLKVYGYQLASHGDKGNSGARNANIFARELAHGKSITGHSHTPESLRDTYIVGTSTKLDLDYLDGSANSWMHCNAALYKGGQVQLLPIINGKWRAK